MDSQKIDVFFAAKTKYFPADKAIIMKEKLKAADDSRFEVISAIELKDPMMMFLISFFVGGLGVDRFMIGDIGMGVLKLLTGGLCGVLTIIDWFLIMGKTKEINYNAVMLAL
ncbi:MAG: TM2 domain-containing protein [Treponema sp.]